MAYAAGIRYFSRNIAKYTHIRHFCELVLITYSVSPPYLADKDIRTISPTYGGGYKNRF